MIRLICNYRKKLVLSSACGGGGGGGGGEEGERGYGLMMIAL